MLSLRVSRDKRGYDYIYLLLEARRRGRIENRLLYCGRWPAPCRVGLLPFDDETRARLEDAHPDVAFDWATLLKTLQAALGVSRLATTGPPPPPPSRSRRPPSASAPPAYGGRPGQPRRPGGPSVTGEVLLVSADIEERETTYVPPEFEPVSEVDRSFAAAVDLELVTDEIVRLPLPEAPQPPARPAGVHVFAEASGPASFDPSSESDLRAGPGAEPVDDPGGDPGVEPGGDPGDDDSADGDDGDTEAGAGADAADAAPGAQPAAELAPGDPDRPRRRRRRRGGRGRGKPPDIRQNSE